MQNVNPIFSTILATIGGGSVTSPDLAVMVDQLGTLDTEIKALTKRADAIKASIKAQGVDRYTGLFYEALVYSSEGRTVTDWRAIAETFELTKDLIKAHTSQGNPTKSIKIERI
jgi:predicted secreted protein